jgi:hypothetical protein
MTMKFPPVIPTSFVALALAAAAYPLQAPVAAAAEARVRELARLAATFERVYFDTPSDGALYARGRDFKMRFDASGATFTPRLGPLEPRNHPLALSPASATLAGEELAFSRIAAVTHDGERVTLDRDTFLETYDLSVGAVEQQFVFAKLPWRGELRLRIEVGSELERGERAEALELRHPRGTVSYGRAVAIDAAGRRTGAPTRFVEGEIEIVVPAAFVEAACLPLVIDPLVQNVPVDVDADDDFAADCAYDPHFQRWLVVFEEAFSAVDHDVRYEIVNTAGASVGTGYVEMGSEHWTDPRCADLNGWHNFLIVAATGASPDRRIRARAMSAGTFFLTPEKLVSAGGPGSGGDHRLPDIGGSSTNTLNQRGCLVYEQAFGGFSTLVVRLLDGDATASSVLPVPASGGGLRTHPSVSKSDGGTEWLVAWSHETSPTAARIQALRVGSGGSAIGTPFDVSGPGFADRFPSASSPLLGTAGKLRAVSFERLFGAHNDVMLCALDGSTLLQEVDLSTLELGTVNPENQVGSSADSDGHHFLVAYSESAPSTHYDVRATELYFDGSFHVAENRETIANSLQFEFRATVAAMGATGGPPERYLLAWDAGQFTGTGTRDVRGAFFEGFTGGTSAAFCASSPGACPCGNDGAAGAGCGNSANPGGATLGASGVLSTLDDQAVLTATGLPPGVSCLLFQGTSGSPAAPFGDGLRCIVGPTQRFPLRQADSSGALSYPGPADPPITVVGAIPAHGGTRFYQGWYRDPAGFCTPQVFNLTSGVRIDWAP